MSESPLHIDCDALDERLLDYLYEEIPEEERRALDAHVAGCARCAAELASFRRVRQAARALPLEEPSPEVDARLLEAAAGRNVVPLPLLGRGAEPIGSDGDAEPSLAATEKILAAARARVAAAPAAPARAAAMEAAGSASAAADRQSAAAGALGTVAPMKPRRRRWYANPSVAAAASFLLVGAGTAWFLSFNREPQLAMRAAEAPSGTTGAAPAPPALVAANDTPEAVPTASAPQGGLAAETEAPVAAKKRAAVDKLSAEALAKAEVPSAEAGEPAAALGAVGRGAGGGGAATGLGTTGVGLGRVSQPGGAVPPAPARKPDGSGITLHADEKLVLDRSVAAADSARKEAKRVEVAMAEPQQAERAYASPPPAAAAPAPSAAPSSRGAAKSADDREEGDLAAIGGAQPAMGKGAAAVAPQAPRDVDTAQRANQVQSRRMSCPDYLSAFEARGAPAAPSVAERLRVADCYAETGQLAAARAEYNALRASHPELGAQIDQRLARLATLEQSSQLAQRRAAEQSAAGSKAKAAPRGKAAKATSEQAAPASPAY